MSAGSGSSSPVISPTFNGNALYFRAFDGIHGFELWRATAPRPGPAWSRYSRRQRIVVSPVISTQRSMARSTFVLMMASMAWSLWEERRHRASGTEHGQGYFSAGSGTVVLPLSHQRQTARSTSVLMMAPNWLRVIWKSDGTAAGTVMVKIFLAGQRIGVFQIVSPIQRYALLQCQ